MKMDSVSRCYNLIWLRMLLMCVIFCVVRAQAKVLSRENVAVGKPAKISTTHKDPASGPACKAVDGSRNTTYTTEKGKQSCVSSGKGDKAPVWEVNLDGTYQIGIVKVYWDEETKDKHAGAILKINGKQCNVFSKIGTNPSEAWCNMVGTSISMSLSGDALLRLCEVEAWVCFPGFYGKHCNDSCTTICDNNMACDSSTGQCPKRIIKPPEECKLIPIALLIAALSIPIGLIFFFICRRKEDDEEAAEGEEKEKEGQQGEEGEKEGEGGEGGEGGEEAAADAGPDAASEAGPDNE
ncbi:uncharacterized protein LOC112571923 isoform X2 [Pomacea canaliculata]|uniref:uncharacterized protein LOC112571923 isoform X2 n=1 Tax=Pomacea canaliculata TaxID=400727 RepID=UPI000D731486|nr:uncharacterized protein LOC112571923 isoform X2 [Pomacea canaliculata]